MHSRSASWVYFPLQELLASDMDMGVARMRVSISTIIVSPRPPAYSISPLAKTTSRSRRIVEFVACWSLLGCSDWQTRGFLMT